MDTERDIKTARKRDNEREIKTGIKRGRKTGEKERVKGTPL